MHYSLKKLYEIITSQNKALVTEAEFLAFAEIAKHENEDYFILGQSDLYYDGPETPLMEYEVINATLIDDDMDKYHEILHAHQEKTYYIPEKRKRKKVQKMLRPVRKRRKNKIAAGKNYFHEPDFPLFR